VTPGRCAQAQSSPGERTIKENPVPYVTELRFKETSLSIPRKKRPLLETVQPKDALKVTL
jgi:hypothetical protein